MTKKRNKHVCIMYNDKLCRVASAFTDVGATTMITVLSGVFPDYDFMVTEEELNYTLEMYDSTLHHEMRSVLLRPYEYKQPKLVLIEGGKT